MIKAKDSRGAHGARRISLVESTVKVGHYNGDVGCCSRLDRRCDFNNSARTVV